MALVAEGCAVVHDGAGVQAYFYNQAIGLGKRINHHLVMEARELEGREASPLSDRFNAAYWKLHQSRQ